MRIRSIKPEFFSDEDINELPDSIQKLFIGLWCLADSEGRLEYRPKFIKSQVFPYTECDIESMLSELGKQRGSTREAPIYSRSFTIRYRVSDREYLQIRNFSKHQRISGKEAQMKSKFPPPPPSENEEGEATGKQPGSTGERQDAQEQGAGKGYIQTKKKKKEKDSPKDGEAAFAAAPASPVQALTVVSPDSPVVKEKPPHVDLVERFCAVYETKTGEPFKPGQKEFVLAAKLLKDYGGEWVAIKANALARMCGEGVEFPCKRGWADFTLGNLSTNWEKIMATNSRDPDAEMKAALKRQEAQDARTRQAMGRR